MEQNLLDREVTVCKALASPVRLGVLDLLSEKACSASELQQALGIAAPNLSQQLTVLKAAGLIQLRRTNRHLYIALASPAIAFTRKVIRQMLRQMLASQAALYDEFAAEEPDELRLAETHLSGAEAVISPAEDCPTQAATLAVVSHSSSAPRAEKLSAPPKATRVGIIRHRPQTAGLR